jgi:hypothetical protein
MVPVAARAQGWLQKMETKTRITDIHRAIAHDTVRMISADVEADKEAAWNS